MKEESHQLLNQALKQNAKMDVAKAAKERVNW